MNATAEDRPTYSVGRWWDVKTGHGYGVGCSSEEEALEEAKKWPLCLFIDVYERVDPHEYKPVYVRKIHVCKK